MMPVLSNKKFLVLFAMVACMASSFSTVNAAGVRRRRLSSKKTKAFGSNGGIMSGVSGGSLSTGVTATGISVVVKPVVVNPISVEGFGQKCPNEANALDTCVGLAGGEVTLCKTCIVGLAGMLSVDLAGLNSCAKPQVNGGLCKSCYEGVKDYYNCGTGKSLGVTSTTTTTTTTTTTAGSSSGIVTGGGTNTSTSTGTTTAALITGYAPVDVCPNLAPVSGDSCVTKNYEFLQCFYPSPEIKVKPT
jgi:hypothetical protein